MTLELKLSTKMTKKIPVIAIEGEIDVYTYPALNQALLNLIKEEHYTIIVDLEKVSYIDSTGLGVLANSTNKIAGQDGELRVICNQPQLIKIFSVSGLLNKNLRIFASEEEALTATKVKPKKK